MITFILNNTLIKAEIPAGTPLLDFIRSRGDLSGTKVGCREGDCGACTVMAGELVAGRMQYTTIVSCLTPLANVQAKHVVTIEGLQFDDLSLSPVQKALVDNSATQCGFCTPGFVVSLTAHGLSQEAADPDNMQQAVSGNICRCTGYKSIEQAARDIGRLYAVSDRKQDNAVKWMVENHFLPAYFTTIPDRIAAIISTHTAAAEQSAGLILAGGTDLLVQQTDTVIHAKDLNLFAHRADLRTIEVANGCCTLGAAVTAHEIMTSKQLQSSLPSIRRFFSLISSTQVRYMGTLGGNIMNGSPIADLSVFFLALDAVVIVTDDSGRQWETRLKDFFIGYKKQRINEGAFIKALRFQLPDTSQQKFNFEKVGKRQHLDIASVNTALLISVQGDRIEQVHLSAGGVAPVPLYLQKTCSFLGGKRLNSATLLEAGKRLQEEITPISDIRGSESYKRLLLRQLFFAHFITLFPDRFSLRELLVQPGNA
jgi:xanthine dehydrogenase small subunit